MTDRVLLGNRGGEYGLWVSRPGFDVKTAGEDGLLMSTSIRTLQVVRSGSFSGTGVVGISWAPVGFRPRLFFGTQHAIQAITYTSDNSASINVYDMQGTVSSQWNVGSVPTLSSTTYWFAINEPA